jgi:hypothetical protein
MPQPITTLVSDPHVILDTNVLAQKPDFAILVVRIFATWAGLERDLSVLLVRLLGAVAAPAHAIFSILQTQTLQTKALEAAAKSALSPDDLDIFGAALSVINSVQKTRNRLAHWAWARCDQRPDLLLLGDPSGLKERDTRVAAHFQSMKPGDINLFETYDVVQFDCSKFYAYTKADLEREVRDLAEADHIMMLFGAYLDPSFGVAHAKAFGLAETPEEIRAQTLGLLAEQRLFREALEQVRAKREKTQTSQDMWAGSGERRPPGNVSQ